MSTSSTSEGLNTGLDAKSPSKSAQQLPRRTQIKRHHVARRRPTLHNASRNGQSRNRRKIPPRPPIYRAHHREKRQAGDRAFQMSSEARQDRIRKLVALCIKNNITPEKITFGNFVRRVCLSTFGLEKQAAKSMALTVYGAWTGDHWKIMVQDNPYLTEEQSQKWIKEH